MKKQLLILLFILSSFSGFSQNWINPGATWTFPWWYIAGMRGVDKIEYTHDTVILGKTCQVLHTTRKEYGPSGAGPGGPIVFWGTEHYYNYTYNNGDTVFYYADSIMYSAHNNFEILYNFAATAGQSWDLGADTNQWACSSSIITVDSVSIVNIGGTSRRVLHTTEAVFSTIGLGPSGSPFIGARVDIVEGLGALHYLFPLPRACDGGVLDLYAFSFACFSDGVTDYTVLAPGECDNPLHLSVAEAAETVSMNIYPNPAENELTLNVTNSGPYTATVYNMLGESVLGQTVTDTQTTLNIATLQPGMYMIALSDQQGKTTAQRFVKK